jgi:hypothetical protein
MAGVRSLRDYGLRVKCHNELLGMNSWLDQLRAYFLDRVITTRICYPVSPKREPTAGGIMDAPCPVSEEIRATTLSLPTSMIHTERDADAACEALNSFRVRWSEEAITSALPEALLRPSAGDIELV